MGDGAKQEDGKLHEAEPVKTKRVACSEQEDRKTAQASEKQRVASEIGAIENTKAQNEQAFELTWRNFIRQSGREQTATEDEPRGKYQASTPAPMLGIGP